MLRTEDQLPRELAFITIFCHFEVHKGDYSAIWKVPFGKETLDRYRLLKVLSFPSILPFCLILLSSLPLNFFSDQPLPGALCSENELISSGFLSSHLLS